MISDPVLTRAVDQGLLTAEQADGLRKLALSEAETQSTPAISTPPPLPLANRDEASEPDDEKLRFVTGFADMFVTLGLALFFGSVAFLVRLYAGGADMWVIIAVLAWLLAEFFTRRRRMALPSIVLLAVFTIAIFEAVLEFAISAEPGLIPTWWVPWGTLNWFRVHAASMLAAGLVTAVFAGVHYWRFRVPITIAAGAGALCAAFVAFAYWLMPAINKNTFDGVLFVCGLCVFALAMHFDMSDPARQTRRTDIAFWLHLLAAPLIVHPLLETFVHRDTFQTSLDTTSALAVLGVFLLFGIVSLIIDRRALLVSGLTYAGLAFGTLLSQTELADKSVPATLLALGIFILLLSAGWRPLRNAALRLVPPGLATRLPHPRAL